MPPNLLFGSLYYLQNVLLGRRSWIDSVKGFTTDSTVKLLKTYYDEFQPHHSGYRAPQSCDRP
jgi:hypothetical protein